MNREEIFHTSKVGNAKVFHTGTKDGFTPFTAIFRVDRANKAGRVTIRVENDSPKGDRSVFVDRLQLKAGHSWTVDAACEARWDDWKLATAANLLASNRQSVYQYKISHKTSSYFTPTTQLLWDWSKFQELEGEYKFVTAQGVRDSFKCSSSTEVGTFGVGCSNGGSGKPRKVLGWDKSCVGGAKACRDATKAQGQICQDHPDAFEVSNW